MTGTGSDLIRISRRSHYDLIKYTRLYIAATLTLIRASIPSNDSYIFCLVFSVDSLKASIQLKGLGVN